MRIGFTTSVIQRGKSGIARYVFSLVHALRESSQGHKFTLFVLEDDLPLFAAARENMQIVPISERHRAPVRDILWHQTELPRLARQHRLDVLHVPSYRRLIWPRPCALVGTIHDLAPFRLKGKYDWKRTLYGKLVVRHLARRQDHIIAVSHTTAADVARYFKVPAARMTVIHNGLDHARFTPDQPHSDTMTARLREHGVHRPFFLYVARLEHPAKNHLRLIAAFNALKTRFPSPWQLVLIGSDWHGAEVIHQAVARSPFAADIRTVGFVGDAELPSWYRAASAFVYPSLFEGFGLPPLEAMACGCPVLVSADGALGEVCGDAALTVDACDVGDLQVKLEILSRDAALRERLRRAGLARARQFDWRLTAAKTLDVYARAAGRVRSPVLAPVAHLAH